MRLVLEARQDTLLPPGGGGVQGEPRSMLSSSHGNETLKTPGLGINMF